MPTRQQQVASIAQTVLRARKYRDVSPDVVERLAEHALAVQGKSPKEATASVKRALHQAYGAFGGGAFPLTRMRRELGDADLADQQSRGEALRRWMRSHSSTAERVDILASFYATVLSDTAPGSVLDLGCGLNGLSLPLWPRMPGHYHGIDLDASMLSFVGEVLDAVGVPHHLSSQDLIGSLELPAAELVLMLKLYPTLEQQSKGSGAALIEALNAPRIVVSFPARSLGRHERGMVGHYQEHFGTLAEQHGWQVREHRFDSELVYLVDKSAGGPGAGSCG